MALTHIPLEQINETHLQSLIDAGAAESLYIEYKSQTYGGNDDSRAEFLADISSFANTTGGDLIVGMQEAQGKPQSFSPFVGDADAELLRLQQMARDGLQQRVSNLQFVAVPVQGGAVLMVRIPHSYNAPHRISFKNKNRFWARSSGGKYEPNVEELRTLFNAAPQIAERIRDFRIDRVSKIAAGLAPVSLSSRVLLVLHVVPFSAFDLGQTINISDIAARPSDFPPPVRDQSANWHVNFDGLLTTSNATATQQPAYAQVYRSGIVEGVSNAQRGQGNVSAAEIEAIIVRWTLRYMTRLHTYGMKFPMAVLPSLLGVRDVPMINGMDGNALFPTSPSIIRADQLHFMETIFENLPTNNKECAKIMRPMLEQLANTAGLSASATFDASGVWRFT